MPYKDPEKAKQSSRERQARYYAKNRDKCIAAGKKWKDQNQDKCREYHEEYVAANKETMREKRKAKNLLNKKSRVLSQPKTKEEILKYHKEWRDKNAARLKVYQAEQRRKNYERIKQENSRWMKANPEKVKAYRDKYMETYLPRKLELTRHRYRTRPEVRERARAAVKRYTKENPEWAKQNHRRQHLRKYGLTPERWQEMFKEQGERCAACKSTEPSARGKAFHVDHCHKTKKVRGILCHHCNLMLGNAKDDITRLEAAIVYLKERS